MKSVHQSLGGVNFLSIREKGKSQISSSNLKVSNDNEELKNAFYGMDSYFSEDMVFCGLFF